MGHRELAGAECFSASNLLAAPSAKQNGLRMPMVLHPEAGGP
jgi:hypothetical protein